MSDQDQYADWTAKTIASLLAEHEAEWRGTLPWPILELIQRSASGRLVDRDTIDPLVERIQTWSKAYPVEVFPPPPNGQHAATIDGCFAHAARHVIGRLMELIPEGTGLCT